MKKAKYHVGDTLPLVCRQIHSIYLFEIAYM